MQPFAKRRPVLVGWLAFVSIVLLSTLSWGQEKAAPDGSWAAEIEALSRWVAEGKGAPRCTERCFALDKLTLRGAVGEGPLSFELSGSVLADGPVAVPLFGPPSHVRLNDLKEDGRDAAVGFEGDHYFLYTAARRFVLKGTLTIEGDLALAIPGPLNTLQAELTGGSVVEGATLSGLSGSTIHLTREGTADKAEGPAVFQLSRAVRVGREISFEYKLVMRSGSELGVVRLPLAFGEEVLDVSGSSGFRVEGAELILPTSGRSVEMTITGRLAKVGSFSPDARSGYEWWLLESDPEHRITAKGDARQVDSAQSPISRREASSRLFLVQRGESIDVSVQALGSLDVLAAVVRNHDRTVVLTQRGDLVSDDSLSYENNGIDYLLYTPKGRPIYLATDDVAERIMHQGADSEEVLIPLRTGSHRVRTQALAQAGLSSLAGSFEVPMPTYPLTASRVSLTFGLPPSVVPVALLGGDRARFFLDAGDLTAMVIGLLVGFFAVRPKEGSSRRTTLLGRALGGVILATLWLVWPSGYVLALAFLSAIFVLWLLARLLQGPALVFALFGALGVVGLVGLIGLVGTMGMRSASDEVSRKVAYPAEVRSPAPTAGSTSAADGDRAGNFLAQTAEGGVLQGVTPVALDLPDFSRSLRVSRELVTQERPFRPVLFYVTEWLVWPLAALWLAGAFVIALSHREALRQLFATLRERLAKKPEPVAALAPQAPKQGA